MVDPTNWDDTKRDDSRWLDLEFDGRDWVAVFTDALGVFHAAGRIPAHDRERRIDELALIAAESFALATASYPMLGRLSSTYMDVIYKREEVPHLREECVKVRAAAISPESVKALGKLVAACDEAVKLSSGLFFACP